MMSRSAAWMPRQQGRRTQAIINTNLKTELCRNWQNGSCTYGERCAFAHGKNELKYRTLREMQNAGRIPDAAKYRCFPCMTWVATGSCPYSTRCVFIHDPRVCGPVEAWLYAGSHPSSAYHSSDSSFFFPDLPRDPDSLDLPRGPSLYDLDPSMATAEDRADRAVYNLWYSFVSTFSEAGVGSDTCDMTSTTSSPLAITTGVDIIRDTSQTTGSISAYADSDYSGPPSVGSSPTPPPAADSDEFQAGSDGFSVDLSSASLVAEQLFLAEPVRLGISPKRLPVFLNLGKGDRAPPLNNWSRSSSTDGSSFEENRPLTLRDRTDLQLEMVQRAGPTPHPDCLYEPDLCADAGLNYYRSRSISPPTHAEDRSLYHNMPHHDFCPSVAATKTPQPDYPLGPESASMPVFQPIEVVQSSSSVITQNGRREDGLSATMGIDPTPPGFVLERHQHLPTFSGYSRVGPLVDQPRTMYSVASF